jgi:hypothetical protein
MKCVSFIAVLSVLALACQDATAQDRKRNNSPAFSRQTVGQNANLPLSINPRDYAARPKSKKTRKQN